MTKLNKSLLREMMDEVIISHRNGKPYLKRRPKKVKNPKTEQQINQRGKFRAASAFVSRNLDVLIRPYWNPEAKRRGMTGQNLFCKINTQAFDADGNPDFEKLQLAVGDLKGIECLRTEVKVENSIYLKWKNNSGNDKTIEENEIKLFGVDEALQVEAIECNVTRKQESCLFSLNLEKYSALFLFFWDRELHMTSMPEWIIF
ncbi:DUF6266 family protein [Marinifilum sp.]|uniref:DUF6266 family protein n=1 Tax=Marinifilum sp. TaxID=2033137 RepID=UPI003BACC31F